MNAPTRHELTGIAAIAAVLCGLTLAAAFAGAGIAAFAVLAILAGPASVLGYRVYSNHRDDSVSGPQRHAHRGADA